MSTYFTIPAGHGLVDKQIARGSDVLALFNRVDTGFGYLPTPETGANPGFAEVFTVQTPTADAHAATKAYVDTVAISGVVFANQAETDAGTEAAKAVPPDHLNSWPGSTNITTLGTITSLTASAITVDNLSIDGNTVSSTTGDLNLTPVAGSQVVLDGVINVDAGVVTGATSITSTAFVGALTGNADTATTVTAAAQAAITSLGTLTTLTVDDITINGNTISSAGASSLAITPTAGQNITFDGTVTLDAGVIAGATSITSTAFVGTLSTAAQPNVTSLGTLTTLTVDDITINGNTISSAGASTLAINPTAGQTITFDSTITLDAGVIAGATSITSTAFVGDITGDVTGNTSGTAATVTGAAQAAITSLGTLTTLTVDDITINGNTISSAGASTLAINPTAGQAITFDSTITLDAGVLSGITDLGTVGTADIDGGTVDGAVIGGASAAAGTFTAITGSGVLSIDDTTTSTSVTTGSGVFDGGLGIAENLNVGGTGTIAGNLTVTDGTTTLSSAQAVRSLLLQQTGGAGAMYIDQDTNFDALTVDNGGTADGIFINQDANGTALNIDSEATSAINISVASQNTSGSVMQLDNEGNQSSGQVLRVLQNNASSSGNALSTQNEGTGHGILIDQNGNGTALFIDSGATNANNIQITSANTSGQTIYVQSHAINSGTIAYFAHVNASSSGNALSTQNEGTGYGILIDQNGNGTALFIDSEATSAVGVSVNLAGTGDVAQLIGDTGQLNVKRDGDCENTNNAYGAISDRKFKQDEELSGSQWNDVLALSQIVKTFTLKDDPDHRKMLGWVAQDVLPISPGLVKTRNVGQEDEHLGLAYSVAHMKGFKALGEAMARIEQLETEIEQLKEAA